ncbi:gibberellin 20-oxidase [Metarhizium brunneum]
MRLRLKFQVAKNFFSLPDKVKDKVRHDPQTKNGWEYKCPSGQDVPNFRGTTARFMAKSASISGQVSLAFDEDYLVTANDATEPDCISQLRLLHYPAADNASGAWRAGAHTDIGCLTLLFQRDKQDGLEICTGRESHTCFDVGDSFTPIPAHTGPIVVNIGDMLMAWSDDRLKSNFHRVRAREIGYSPPRYSIAYFNQARRGFIVQGPRKK